MHSIILPVYFIHADLLRISIESIPLDEGFSERKFVTELAKAAQKLKKSSCFDKQVRTLHVDQLLQTLTHSPYLFRPAP